MRAAADRAMVMPSARARGRVTVPGDKSISHRYAMLAALADGTTTIHGYSRGADCAATLDCIRALGAGAAWHDDTVVVTGCGRDGLRAPAGPLDALNSGTTMRLMAGILAGQPFRSVLTGDASLQRRPMRRVIEPLTQMGATIQSRDGRPPLEITGARLRSITHRPEVPSAQVKSCVLLAGLFADGMSVVLEETPTRDHTERALETFNVRVERGDGRVGVEGGQRLDACEVSVPGDISGAAFWAALAAGTPGSEVVIDAVGMNPTRTALLDVVYRAGARIDVEMAPATGGEPTGTLTVAFGGTRSFVITPDEVPSVIDEIPALAALAAMRPPGHSLVVRGARELRVKESDRIASLAAGFRAMGAAIEEFDDGFHLESAPLREATVDAMGDHRLAMAFAVAATQASGPVTILGASCVDVSYPGFFDTLGQLTRS